MLLFPSDSLHRNAVETDYRAEWEAARNAGFETALFDFDALRRSESAREVLRLLPREGAGKTLLLRSWMMDIEVYTRLEQILSERGLLLLTSAQSYAEAHDFPRAYAAIEGLTPRSQVVPRATFQTSTGVNWSPIEAALHMFGEGPVIVKDFVKSQKHRWHEACFIPSASNFPNARKVIARFLELQGDFLRGGLVLREFLELQSVGTHPQSGLPMTAEWRAFCFDGTPFFVAPYWADGDYGEATPSFDFAAQVAQKVKARLISVDIARQQSGDWIAIEIGDGQVSGLPSNELAPTFFAALQSRVAPILG